jgi:hypothetical protein
MEEHLVLTQEESQPDKNAKFFTNTDGEYLM